MAQCRQVAAINWTFGPSRLNHNTSSRGNLNGDDRVDLGDVILALRVLTGIGEPSDVELAEVIYILKTMAELGDS